MIDRTFAAVVLDWDVAVVPGRRVSLRAVRRRVEVLCADGVHIAVVGGTGCADVDGRLRARPSGPGRLLLGLNRGSELFEVKADGPHLLRRRVASGAEIAALDRASQVLAGTLASRGLDVRVVAAQRDRRKLDLVPEPVWDGPAEARIGELRAVVAGRLRECGFTGIGDVVRIGAQLAAQCGLGDARVIGDSNYVEIGLTDTPDSMRDILAVLARVGIGPGLVLAVGGHPGPPDAADGSGSLLCFRQAAAVSGGDQPAGPFADISPVGGSPPSVVCLLDEQLRRRRKRRVPFVDQDSAWTVRVTGADRLSPRAEESLFTLGASRKPVVLVPPGAKVLRPAISRVLLPLNGTPESAVAVADTMGLLARAGVDLVVLHVFDAATVPGFWDQAAHARQAWAEEFLARNAAIAGARLELASGSPGEHVVDVAGAEEADLIALGWSQHLDAGRSRTIRRSVLRAGVPVLLLPVRSN